MKMKKGLGALAILLALTAVACNGAPANDSSNANKSTSGGQQSTSAQPSIKVTAADNKKTLEIGGEVQLTADVGYKAGEISITVTKPAAPHPAEPTWPAECPALIDTSAWTAGTPAANSYGKNYTPLTAADGSVGVKIAMGDYNPEGASFDADGKLPTEATGYVKFNVKAPKAGVYQLILKASVSSSGDEYKFAGESSRGLDILVNEYEDQDNVYGDRLYTDAGLDHDEKRSFVFGLVQLNGPTYEDEIAFRNPYYRMKFDTSVDLILAENK